MEAVTSHYYLYPAFRLQNYRGFRLVYNTLTITTILLLQLWLPHNFGQKGLYLHFHLTLFSSSSRHTDFHLVLLQQILFDLKRGNAPSRLRLNHASNKSLVYDGSNFTNLVDISPPCMLSGAPPIQEFISYLHPNDMLYFFRHYSLTL